MRKSFHPSAGASLIEYALMIGLVAIIVIGAVMSLGDWASRSFDASSDALVETIVVMDEATTRNTLRTTPGGTYGDPDPEDTGPIRIRARVPR